MILRTEGEINPYYVQTLCMLFFPGAKFGQEEKPGPGVPEADLHLRRTAEGFEATAQLKLDHATGRGSYLFRMADFPALTEERGAKIAAGRAMLTAGKELQGYQPPWGILTGVRPSKVASELIVSEGGVTRARRVLRDEYFVNPKKAALAVSVAATEMKILRRLPPQEGLCSVYVSIPFCPSRCAYCSFVSNTTGRLLSLLDPYLETLYLDIDNIFGVIRSLGLRVATVYIGGGTPTVLSEEQLGRLLAQIGRHLGGGELFEYTLEAGRPDTITEEKLRIARASGITRISVNPQTLSDELLARIGRRHSVADFYRAYELAASSGIADVNVDLIAGLPCDSFRNFSDSVDAVLALSPSNLTVHSFSVKNAASIRQSTKDVADLTSSADAAKSVDYSQLKTKIAGYRPYYMYRQKNTVGNLENVGYAREGREGLYNIFMMEEMHSIFGVGAGSVTKLLGHDGKGNRLIRRIFTPKYPYEYLKGAEKIRCGDRTEGQASIADEIGEFYRRNL